MIYGKMWTVVKPSVGLPLFFVAVATTALIVHIGILTHTTWFPAFLQGGLKKTSEITTQPTTVVGSIATPVTIASAR